MEKVEQRKEVINRLQQLSKEEIDDIQGRLHNHLFNSELWSEASSIGVTVSQGFEWNTRPIIERAWEEGKTVSVPKCDPKEKKLQFYKLRSYDQLEKVYYGLLEPNPEQSEATDKQNINLLIVPGVVFNKEGYRIGFGGGFYDRFLVDYPNEMVSLLSSHQLAEDIPVESHDIPVNHMMTEEGFIK
ncbi:MAG TPA: 5-formyltetrahydrofolate cyclo-ligase [Bacillota bacterium]|nr:5-formyltetrahydrofolate cyclo-ligase [Bacillota bacterium]